MKIRIYLQRDTYGNVIHASHRMDLMPNNLSPYRTRDVSTTKQLAAAMLQSGTRKLLFDAAWRKAVQVGAVDPSHTFRAGESFDAQTIEYAKQEAFQVDSFISELVNNSRSRFYIHG